MVSLAATIIFNLNNPDTLQQLALNDLCVKGEHSDPYDEEKHLINALLNNRPTKLTYLNLNWNREWFTRDSEAAGYLLDFIKSQTCLEELSLSWNYLSSTVTEQVFEFLATSSCVTTIKDVDMSASADLSTESACLQLANLINLAHSLEKCVICL